MNYDKIINVFSPHVERVSDNFSMLYRSVSVEYNWLMSDLYWFFLSLGEPNQLPIVGC
tara:strand:+ start:128 stop:301 length:174 start_codon:yes stop_codon:yes gene_type:complete